MDYSLPSADGARPWRTATLVAASIATLELIALIVLGVALLGEPVAERARQTAAERATPPPNSALWDAPAGAATRARSRTSVLVLNGNGVSGAAARSAAAIRRFHYRISAVANAPASDYPRSVIMYRPGFRAEGQRLGRDLGVKLVGPLDGLRTGQLMGAHVVFILGAR